MKRQCGPRKKHKLDYCVIGQYLRQFCTTTNDNDLTDTGPYGQTATSLFWSNSIKNRKHLQVVWKENRGNVQNEGELVSTNPVKNDNKDEDSNDRNVNTGFAKANESQKKYSIGRKRNRLSFNRNKETISISSDESDDHITRSTRKLRKQKTPFTPSIKPKSPTVYCICSKHYTEVDSGRMIECQGCRNWYHCSCLSLPVLESEISGKHIFFKCGRKTCNNGQFDYKVKGIAIMPDTLVLQNMNRTELLIANVEKRSKRIQREIKEFSDSNESFQYRKLSEQLTRCLLELDSIDTHQQHQMRSLRKATIDNIHLIIKELDASVVSSQHSKRRDTIPKQEESDENNISNFTARINETSPFRLPDPIEETVADMNVENVSLESATPLNSFEEKQTDVEECQLNHAEIEQILNVQLPSFFTMTLPTSSSFILSDEDMVHLNNSQNGRCYKKGHWQHIFAKGIATSNKHCVFMFDKHQISTAKKRRKRRNVPMFKCKGHCKFKDCSVKVYVEMLVPKMVSVFYSGNMKHKITDQHARPIRATQREILKESFKNGGKPLKHFLEAFEKKDTDQIISGNCDNVGKDAHVFRQISSESRQIGRMDKDLIQSLLTIMRTSKENGFGFIQQLSVKPFTVQYWSEEGLRLYHSLAEKNIVFWDATGSVVRKSDDGKRFLYYELALRHPVKGKMGIPVSSMVTDDQSLPSILNWIARFRHDEKKLFGHGNVSQPKMIISDESWVFIIAALKEFNTETLAEFLNRAWRIANEHEPKERKDKTIVHLCTGHFMNKVKRFCLQNYKRNIKFGMYLVSLLLNCKTLKAATEILHDISVALLSKNITSANRQFIDRLMQKINKFDTKESSCSELPDDSEKHCEQQKPGFYTEEAFISLAGTSPFKQWACGIVERTRNSLHISDEKSIRNPYYSEVFLQQILDRYIPILPLWGSLILPSDSSNAKHHSIYNTGDICKTQSTIENRFRILKQISLGDNKNRRLDDFSEELRKHTVSIQRLVVKDTLKAPSNLKRKRSQSTLKEAWSKKQKPLNISTETGDFQKPPTKVINLPEVVTLTEHRDLFSGTKVCPIDNLGSTCWFNSVMQAVSGCKMSESLQNHEMIIDVDKDSYNTLKRSVISLLRTMSKNKCTNTKAPREQVRQALSDIAKFEGELGANLGQQHDANEFYLKIVSPIAKDIGEQLQIQQAFNCIDCKYRNCITECLVNSIGLTVPNDASDASISSLLNYYFEHEIREQCQKCSGLLYLQQELTKIPTTLVLTVNRFQYNAATSNMSKLKKSIQIDREIDLSKHVKGVSNCRYVLKSVVCHHGRSINSGHYTTNLIANNSIVKVSDANVSVGSENEMQRDCYVLFYDRHVNLPDFVKPALECIGNTLANTVSASCQNQSTVQEMFIPALLKQGDIDTAVSLISKHVDAFTSNNYFNMFEVVLKTIFGCGKEASYKVSAHSFLLSKVRVSVCNVCKNKMIERDDSFCVLKPLTLFQTDIVNSFAASTNMCSHCQTPDVSSDEYICSLPESMILCPQQTMKATDMALAEIDLESSMKTVFPLVSRQYQLLLTVVKDEGIVRIIKHGPTNNTNNESTPCVLKETAEVVATVYDLKPKSASFTIMPTSRLKEDCFTPLRIPNKSFKDSLHNQDVVHQNGTISLDTALCMARDTYWLSSDDVNNYMKMLCLMAPEKVHFVDAGWFSHKILKDETLTSSVFSLENSKQSWFGKSKVVVPVNLRNVHWVLVVIDIKEKVMYFCDSKGDPPKIILLQITRYISYEFLMRFGRKLDLSKWKYIEFCKELNFPIQIDDSSCGVYICEMAKSILYKKRIYHHNKLATRMRAQVVRELYSGSIEF